MAEAWSPARKSRFVSSGIACRPPLKSVLLNSNSRWCVSDPLARFARVSPSGGGDYRFLSPSVRGRAAEGGRGSLTHHLEELGNRGPKAGAYKCHPPFTSCFRNAFNCSR